MAKILVIDDSWLARRGLTGMLSGSDHTVTEAENGMDGLKLIRTKSPDCIILDLLMPEMDGYEVLEILKEKENTIPVVVCSADIQETARQKCIELGATCFLNKPPKEQEIIAVIKTALGGRK